ncbi:class E sortase [Streptomyces sp. DSM 15324]|uniref:class E sortase n=1 Tax=Streptomyces sp. DSM 15324 TaxID=1739111 RepID=UPI000749A18D|nr:class E sortase [Streptomyces sp. DSM 15324]KUO08621.1 hypothetical protein AQJ58_28540 [Streptomyces sp. DSM 15324]
MTALRPEREDSYGSAPYESFGVDAYAGERPPGAQPYVGDPRPGTGRRRKPAPGAEPRSGAASGAASGAEAFTQQLPPIDEETVALRIPEPPPGADPFRDATGASGATAAPPVPGTPAGGRAARRRAAKGRRGRVGGSAAGVLEADEPAIAPSQDERPLSRVEARRQAKARKPSAAVVASRAVGEVFITTGVLMLLFVSYQLWWTNVRAHAQASKEANSLQDDWATGKRNPGTFSPGQGFAILHIPKLDVVVPIAEGVSNKKVLDKGMVGHYGEGALKTAMPEDKSGNFGLAGHRNTHGEPFRYINRLQQGDDIVVETQDEYFVYKMTSSLPVTSPKNTSVLDAVPPQSGFTAPGRYITLTTCTPEFTSKYRLIVWGKMVEERPRSKGKPDALVE